MLIRKMSPVGGIVLVAAAAIALSGCASSGVSGATAVDPESSEADAMAVSACAITIRTTGKAKFHGAIGLLDREARTNDKVVQRWEERAKAAAAAAAGDPAYSELKNLTRTVYVQHQKAVQTLERIKPWARQGGWYDFYEVWDDEEISKNNEALSGFEIECAVLADRINAQLN